MIGSMHWSWPQEHSHRAVSYSPVLETGRGFCFVPVAQLVIRRLSRRWEGWRGDLVAGAGGILPRKTLEGCLQDWT